ncbi:trypsin-like peptidase domain-containing protein [Pseudomonas alliivorans]|nr:trypsin-like peptidase domain-containing protein [Pseudomonas alliivorans]MEE4721073.1 trypsin-like peptidase domain-containing protein [Pseudomonas alliivorans]MEE4756347.1 trypsin-like peptidase domain-containing protein [Pseudomonas alliivorans]MEE4762148.1 trypsin-like peptidase domain-containing protein [Pseudomonas alliivorans]MEE4772518.1 trypsin-like peptidase domain-containing protein [Pseudomonas alliivorans]
MNGGFFLNFTALNPCTAPEDLAKLLGTDYRKIKHFYYRGDMKRHYLAFEISKKSGGKRKILAPTDKLKTIQGRIAGLLSKLYKPRAPVKAFLVGQSIVANARPHCRKKYVFNIDLENFFGTITFRRVRGMLMAKPYSLSPETASVIAHLTTVDGLLPQGAPSSPVISNMICASLDRELYSLAKRHRAVYTRYADDMTFSFYTPIQYVPRGLVEWCELDGKPNHYSSKVGHELAAVIAIQGFKINEDKVRLQGERERQLVTGLVTNQKPNVPRPYIRKTAALVHSVEKFGLEVSTSIFKEKNPNTTANIETHLQGRLLYIKQVVGEESKVYRRLAQRYNMLPIKSKVPNTPIATPEDSDNFKIGKFIKDKCWVIEINEEINGKLFISQGSAFLIDGRLLVTCEHVLAESFNDGVRVEVNECLIRRMGDENIYEAKVIIRSKDLDIAVLKIVDPPAGLEVFSLEDIKEPNIGDRVAVLGFPNFKEGSNDVGVLKCRLTNKYPLSGVMHSEVDKTLYSGNSGGPVVNTSYHVVGIAAQGAAGNPEGKNSFIRVSELKKYLDKSGAI